MVFLLETEEMCGENVLRTARRGATKSRYFSHRAQRDRETLMARLVKALRWWKPRETSTAVIETFSIHGADEGALYKTCMPPGR